MLGPTEAAQAAPTAQWLPRASGESASYNWSADGRAQHSDGSALNPSSTLVRRKIEPAANLWVKAKHQSNPFPEGASASSQEEKDSPLRTQRLDSPDAAGQDGGGERTSFSSEQLVSLSGAGALVELATKYNASQLQERTKHSTGPPQDRSVTGREILSIVGGFRNNEIQQCFR